MIFRNWLFFLRRNSKHKCLCRGHNDRVSFAYLWQNGEKLIFEKINFSIEEDLKELRNCILCIILVWSLFRLVRIYKNLHFLPILLVKLGFCLSIF